VVAGGELTSCLIESSFPSPGGELTGISAEVGNFHPLTSPAASVKVDPGQVGATTQYIGDPLALGGVGESDDVSGGVLDLHNKVRSTGSANVVAVAVVDDLPNSKTLLGCRTDDAGGSGVSHGVCSSKERG